MCSLLRRGMCYLSSNERSPQPQDKMLSSKTQRTLVTQFATLSGEQQIFENNDAGSLSMRAAAFIFHC